MSNKHLFVVDPINNLNLKLDTSMHFAKSLIQHGQYCFITNIEKISWISKNRYPHAMVRQLKFSPTSSQISLSEEKKVSIDDFKTIHIRKEPPVNYNYLHTTLLLENAPKETIVLNSPRALRDYNEKITPLLFPQHSIKTLISYSEKEIYRFLDEFSLKKIILKPMNLFSGKGIIALDKSKDSKEFIESSIQQITKNGQQPIIIQEFLDEIYQGELRVFTARGKCISWAKKVPAQGNFLANTRNGASLEPYSPEKSLVDMVEKITKELYKKGIYYTGIDIIKDKISEINITSPRLLCVKENPEQAFAKLAEDLLDFIDKK
ncbi:MAG: hypothetical protein CMP11_07780 [Zetaproteobacteria bacterium]|nr:hypothetical protein [Pseudobdellovibrionaceae bacterium]|tara:strand:- start:630 stop:1589 length:960 start_codon:yes stop_codon:yes gene_type:complete